jgi:F420-non-reducing hydrogenase iron-sulfur subunit
MVITQTRTRPVSEYRRGVAPRITVFHCYNAMDGASVLESNDAEFKVVKMPCSSLIREVHLLRAFEDGADAVLVMACPEGKCRYLEGNLRAAKRVARVKKLLDEIGLDGRRLELRNVPPRDAAAIESVINEAVDSATALGPNPAA